MFVKPPKLTVNKPASQASRPVVQRDNLAINHGIVRQTGEPFYYGWELTCEILLVARPELRSAPRLPADGPEAVELQLLTPFLTLGQRLRVLAEHWFK
jgi:hypothetical protein